MYLRIEKIEKKKLIGRHKRMSLSDDKTFELWKSFMIEKSLVRNRINTDFISMQVYNYSDGVDIFNPELEFDKWAAVEVSDFNHLPEGMESYTLQSGLYAVFLHKGGPGEFPETYNFIYGKWLPASEYELDCREHFEILGEKYKNNDPASEEEIWIPIRKKK